MVSYIKDEKHVESRGEYLGQKGGVRMGSGRLKHAKIRSLYCLSNIVKVKNQEN